MLIVVGAFSHALPAQAYPAGARNAHPTANYPPNPSADLAWQAGLSSVADIQSAFNQARANENSQLGTSLPVMTLPAQAQWNAFSDGARAAWLINQERAARGVMQMQGEQSDVTSIAQSYAQYLFSHNAFAHDADGSDPWKRLAANPAIGACHDFLGVAENLSVFATTGSSIPLALERSIYGWLYDDSGSSWGHREAALWSSYNDNSGQVGKEGFLGIGLVSGGPYQGPFSRSYPLATIVVMDVFDPCSAWKASIYNLFLPLLTREPSIVAPAQTPL